MPGIFAQYRYMSPLATTRENLLELLGSIADTLRRYTLIPGRSHAHTYIIWGGSNTCGLS